MEQILFQNTFPQINNHTFTCIKEKPNIHRITLFFTTMHAYTNKLNTTQYKIKLYIRVIALCNIIVTVKTLPEQNGTNIKVDCSDVMLHSLASNASNVQ